MSKPDPVPPREVEQDGALRRDGRDETPNERLDRNWNALLQELRVTQTGTQIIAGFLLTLPFQDRFAELDQFQVTVYLVMVCGAALTTAFGLGPVSLHRLLFRRGAMAQIVDIGNRLVRATLVGVAFVLTGTTLLIFDVVIGRIAGIIAGGGVLIITILIWIIVPRLVKPTGP
ncbi:MAG TPA: DUF6328 family protein [Glaciibacter sp.]|nr:DUF6328 family protein [Glaciibacter sp.]